MPTKWAIAIMASPPIYRRRELYVKSTGRADPKSSRSSGHRCDATRDRARFDLWMLLARDHQRRSVRRDTHRLRASDRDLWDRVIDVVRSVVGREQAEHDRG